MKTTDTFRHLVESRIAELGMSKVELARKVGKTPSGLTQLLRSDKPHATTIHAIAVALDVPTSYFFE